MLCPLRAPDLLEKLRLGDKVSWLTDKYLDHAKLDPCERNLGAIGIKRSPSRYVNGEVVGHNGGRLSIWALSATKRRSKPSQEFLDSEWLGNIVICTGVERCHNLGFAPTLGHNNDHYVGPGSQVSDQLRRIQLSRVDKYGVITMSVQMPDSLLDGSNGGHFVSAISECGRLDSARVVIWVQQNDRRRQQPIGGRTIETRRADCA